MIKLKGWLIIVLIVCMLKNHMFFVVCFQYYFFIFFSGIPSKCKTFCRSSSGYKLFAKEGYSAYTTGMPVFKLKFSRA